MRPTCSLSALRRPFRRAARGLSSAALFLLASCGAEAPAPTSDRPAPPAPAPRGEREVLTEDDEAYHRGQALKPRDTPLAVGATAPAFPGLPERALTVLVFFRGEW